MRFVRSCAQLCSHLHVRRDVNLCASARQQVVCTCAAFTKLCSLCAAVCSCVQGQREPPGTAVCRDRHHRLGDGQFSAVHTLAQWKRSAQKHGKLIHKPSRSPHPALQRGETLTGSGHIQWHLGRDQSQGPSDPLRINTDGLSSLD